MDAICRDSAIMGPPSVEKRYSLFFPVCDEAQGVKGERRARLFTSRQIKGSVISRLRQPIRIMYTSTYALVARSADPVRNDSPRSKAFVSGRARLATAMATRLEFHPHRSCSLSARLRDAHANARSSLLTCSSLFL